MKRIGFVLSFLVLVAAPVLATARPSHTFIETADCSELSWATVSAVLKKVADQGRYSYSSLEGWYDAGLLTVTLDANGRYEVRIRNAAGVLDILVIEGL